MSRAGTKSNQGDDYQRLIAMHWLIRLLSDDDIDFIQAESNGIPGIDERISVDDIVVVYKDGQRRHIQAKKNQSRHRAWSLSDLKDEIPKVRDQLESNPEVDVEFYSRSPFGDFCSLAEASRECPDFVSFQRQTGQKNQATLKSIARVWQRSEEASLRLLGRVKFGSHHSYEEWERLNRDDLSRNVPHADLALPVLEKFLNGHQSKLNINQFTISREDVIEHLAKEGLAITPRREEKEILEEFRITSQIGRDWQRRVGGIKIERSEFLQLVDQVEAGAETILVTDRPGSGKTCLLLDLADHVGSSSRYGLLFLKGDRYSRIQDGCDLKSYGLPGDIVGACARLSERRQVVVIIDSLDVLSINREHDALGFFLSLIDRLGKMKKVTVVAACRSFDLKYDPLLRDRTWEHKIQLQDFDYETTVVPLLEKWGVCVADLEQGLAQLLRLPQNLRLFEAIAKRTDSQGIHNAYQLHEMYLDEVVRKNHQLGDSAMAMLQQFADRLLRERNQSVPFAAFPGTEPIRRALISDGVLHQDSAGQLGFGHQTLFDNLVVYSAIARGVDLPAFIKSHPPFPFLRPAVRAFVFHLRAQSPQLFSRQIRAALYDAEVAYHFKRLIVESLAEIDPGEQDWPLIRKIFQSRPELFQRMFRCLHSAAWFRLLMDYWLPSLGSIDDDGKWYVLLASSLKRWLNDCPKTVIGLWRRSIAEDWGKEGYLSWRIAIELSDLEDWETEGVCELITLLLDEQHVEFDSIGKIVSLYVDATNQGDDLLWECITKDLGDGEVFRGDMKEKLHCAPHDFHVESFLGKRLIDSQMLLEKTVLSLSAWEEKSSYDPIQSPFYSAFMNDSSWMRCHSKGVLHSVDGLSQLLDSIEKAFVHHAKRNTAWWKLHEPELRNSNVEVLRYFLINAYIENPAMNVDGMATILTDKQLLRYGHLNYELGMLTQAAYHLLDPIVQERNQKLVLDLYMDEGRDDSSDYDWACRIVYEYLIQIPVIFRLPEIQSFINHFAPKYGPYRSEAEVHIQSCTEVSPITLDQFLALEDHSLLRLLAHYENYTGNSRHYSDISSGGRGVVANILRDAAAHDPMRYLVLAPKLIQAGFHIGYLTKLLEGVAYHLQYRFGRLNADQGWSLIQPPPDGEVVANKLLDLYEKNIHLWESDGFAGTRILAACGDVLIDNAKAERLVFLLFGYITHLNPDANQTVFCHKEDKEDKETTAQDLRYGAMNRVRGIAAESAIALCNRLLEQEKELPELMFPLLRHYARDPVPAIRAALLHHLPYLASKRDSWARRLFSDIYRESQTVLWNLAEKYLYYYQCNRDFDYVMPYLERMRSEADEGVLGVWARLMTFAELLGRVDENDLFGRLCLLDSMAAWEGAGKVFVANMNNSRCSELCISGLNLLVELPQHSEKLRCTLERAFVPEMGGKLLGQDFALKFIDSMNPSHKTHNLKDFYSWIADLADRNPVSALTICEKLMVKLSERHNTRALWRTQPLIAALSSILREADESEDELLIRRAVNLQDEFLRMDIDGIDDYFDAAGHC